MDASADVESVLSSRSKKRQRKPPSSNDHNEFVTAQHPNNVQPLGNSFADPAGLRRRHLGAGQLACLPDEILVELMKWLSPRDICRLSYLSPYLYIVTDHDDLWKTVVLRDREFLPTFDCNWKQTYLTVTGIDIRLKSLKFSSIYSDFLFQPWLNSTKQIPPGWLCRSSIDRWSVNDLTVEMFIAKYEKPRIPVIITDLVTRWPAFSKWSPMHFSDVFGSTKVNVQAVDMTLKAFWSYADQTKDESPLYLFEKDFVNKMPPLGLDFDVPAYFDRDIFQLLGSARPDFRWLVAGPKRSGSTFHQDPNATSAWNAVVTGSKKWIMFPKHVCPPGVIPSDDGSEVTTPLSLIEWFSSFYAQAQQLDPYEGVVSSGELMFIPSGMWHCVLNLDASIAVTQNFVSAQNLLDVLDFSKKCPDLVSGYNGDHLLSEVLQDRVNEVYPGMIENLEKRRKIPRPSFWSLCTKSAAASEKFQFTFSDNE